MTADSTADRLASIRARADAATPGPWTPGDVNPQAVVQREVNELGQYRVIGNWGTHADAAFVGHARADVPFLLDQLAAAVADVDGLLSVVVQAQIAYQEQLGVTDYWQDGAKAASEESVSWMNRALAAEAKIAAVHAEAQAWADSPPGEIAPTQGVGTHFLKILSASSVSALDAVRADNNEKPKLRTPSDPDHDEYVQQLAQEARKGPDFEQLTNRDPHKSRAEHARRLASGELSGDDL